MSESARAMNAIGHCFGALLLAMACTPSTGGELQRAFDAALQNDPTYQAARADLASSLQNLPIARAGLRPTLSLSISDSKVDGSRTIDNPPLASVTQALDYRAPTQSLNLRAPLYNREAAKKIELAQAQEDYALALLRVRQAELADRLAKAWLEGVLADHGLAAARIQLEAASVQNDIAARRLALGEGTRPEVADAASALGAARVQLAEAQSLRDLALLTLRQMRGYEGALVDLALPATSGFAALPALPNHLAKLLDQADTANATLAVRRFAVQASQLSVERARSGHYPRLDFVASLTQASNESLSTINQSARQQSFGLQLNVPLYSGGAVSAGVTQALADQTRAEAELAAEQQAVARDVTRLFYLVSLGSEKMAAQQKAVDSAGLNLESAQKGLPAGLSTQFDIAQAQRKLAQVTQERAQSAQEILLARLRLDLRMGDDPAAAITRLEAALATSPLVAMTTNARP
jgi:outer membrane protein, protease secretion system